MLTFAPYSDQPYIFVKWLLALKTETFLYLCQAGNRKIGCSTTLQLYFTPFLLISHVKLVVKASLLSRLGEEVACDIILGHCTLLWHSSWCLLTRRVISYYFLRIFRVFLLFGRREGSFGGVDCSRDGLGSPLIKCLVCPGNLLCLEGVFFPGLNRIGIMQARRQMFGMRQDQPNIDRSIHSNKI